MLGCQPHTYGSNAASRVVDLDGTPAYSGSWHRFFDDELGAGDTDGLQVSEEAGSLRLANRALASSDMILCRIGTITEGASGDTRYARIEFSGNGQSLTRGAESACPSIAVGINSYSFSIIHQNGAALVGKSIVIFIKTFNEFGQTTLHWHAEFDRPNIRHEIQRVGAPIR